MFIRTSGCHLRCVYCDTKYAYFEGSKMSLEKVLDTVDSYGSKYVCVTGGEPLLQPDVFPLMTELCNRGYFVSLETSGSISCEKVDPRVKKIVDVKTPDSGESNSFEERNISYIDVKDELKFVICSEQDFEWAEVFIKNRHLQDGVLIFYSPSHSEISAQWLAEKILSSKSKARLQLQLHKYIWSPETRGV